MFVKSQTLLHLQKIFSFLKIAGASRGRVGLSVILSIGYTLMALYTVYLLFPLAKGIISNDFGHVVDLAGIHWVVGLFPHIFDHSIRLFILLVAWIYLVTVIKNVFHYFAAVTAQTQARLATIRLRQILLEKCMAFGKSFYDQNTIAYLQAVLTKSTVLIETRFKLSQEMITEVLLIVCYASVMLQISWKLTLVTVIILPIIALLTRSLTQRIRDLSLQQNKVTISLNDKIFNLLYCVPVIKGFGKEDKEIKAFAKLSEAEIEQSFQMQKLYGLVRPIEDVGVMTGNLLIAFAMAAILHAGVQLEATHAFVFFYLVMKAIPGLNAINRFRLGMANSTGSFEDIENILNTPDDMIIKGGGAGFVGLKDGIEFKDLSFSYGAQAPKVLDHVSFNIKKGSVTALVGPSGSGKSTIVNLLLRFYDCPPGAIMIDGKDIREYDIAALRERITFVSQDVFLFNDTIRNNIMYGIQENMSDEELKKVMQNVRIHDFIEKLPQQYNTIVGDRGGRLSGGERQRLAIARAVIRQSDILILDEATSALDSATEKGIIEGVLALANGKTVILIAHRLSTVKSADQVIYLDKGRVVEAGTLQQLIDRKGLFAKQWEAQKL